MTRDTERQTEKNQQECAWQRKFLYTVQCLQYVCLYETQPTDLQRVFDSSDPVELLSTLEFIWTTVSKAGI